MIHPKVQSSATSTGLPVWSPWHIPEAVHISTQYTNCMLLLTCGINNPYQLQSSALNTGFLIWSSWNQFLLVLKSLSTHNLPTCVINNPHQVPEQRSQYKIPNLVILKQVSTKDTKSTQPAYLCSKPITPSLKASLLVQDSQSGRPDDLKVGDIST